MKDLTSINEILNLKNKLTIITGATAGIGKGIAVRLAEAGSDLILISRSQEDLDKTRDELSEYGVNIQTFSVDLANKDNIDEFWNNLGGQVPDILINNAGIFPIAKFLDMNYEEFQKVIDVNLNAVYSMCFNFVRRLKDNKKGGNILNIGSLEALVPVREGLTHYGISKAGVVALTREIAREFGSDDIRANVILPGGVMTRGAMQGSTEFLKDPFGMIKDTYNFKQRLPLGRIGQPDDIAKMVLVMVSELSSYMTGAVIPVDGGFLSS